MLIFGKMFFLLPKMCLIPPSNLQSFLPLGVRAIVEFCASEFDLGQFCADNGQLVSEAQRSPSPPLHKLCDVLLAMSGHSRGSCNHSLL